MRAAAWGLAVLCILGGALGFDRRVERTIDAATLQLVGGHEYYAPLDGLAPDGFTIAVDTNESPTQSGLELFENARPLGPAHSAHDVVRTQGRGAFSHWTNGLHFSTSDNADPRTNGAVYRVVVTARPTRLLTALAYAAVTLGALLVLALLLGEVSTPAKLVALAWVLVLAPRAWLPDVLTPLEPLRLSGRLGLLAVYLAAAVASVVALAVAPFFTSHGLRSVLAVILLASFLLDQALLVVAGQHLKPDLAALFISERDMTTTVVPAYLPSVTPLLAGGALLLLAFLLPVRRWHLPSRAAWLPAGAWLATFGVLLASPGQQLPFPAPTGVPAMFAAALVPRAAEVSAREPVDYARSFTPMTRHLVVIVDESVRGDVMGLNDRRYGNTPFLAGLGDGLVNFGVATSATNCSVATRVILRMGLRPSQLPDVGGASKRQPTIWQYAEAAGFRTTLLDGWGRLHSYMDEAEHQQIDDFMYVDAAEHERDQLLPPLIAERLRGPAPAFVYVNKLGIHPKYALKVPPGVTDTPAQPPPVVELDARRRADVDDYHRALRHSVDDFFADLWPRLPADAAVLYTSDHGQSLYEGGYDLTHCSLTPNAHRGELRVPLFVLTKDAALQRRLNDAASRIRDRADHYALFSTVLEVMGYAADWAEHEYGPSLWTATPGPRGFLLGTYNQPGAYWVPY